MLELASFTLEKYWLWQRPANFVFEPGLTIITGENRSGKSSLFRPLDLSILGAAAGKRGESNNRMPKGARAQTRFATEGRVWSTELTDSKLRLFENNADLGSSGKREARTHLAEALQMPPALWNATVHVTALGDHPLLQGTPQSRLDWLSAVLGLETIYDRAHSALSIQVTAAETAASRARLYGEELAQLPAAAAPPNVVDLERRFAEISASRTRFAAVLDALAALDATPAVPNGELVPTVFARHAARAVDLERELVVAETYEALAATRATREQIQSELSTLPRTRAPAVLWPLLERAEEFDNNVRAAWTQWTEAAPLREQAARLGTILRGAPDNLGNRLQRIEVELASLREQIHKLAHETGANCSVCARPLPPAARTRLANTAQGEVSKRVGLQQRLQAWHTAALELDELDAHLATIKQPTKTPLQPAYFEGLREELGDAEQRASLEQRLRDLGQEPAGARRPSAPAAELRRALEEARASVNRMQQLLFQIKARTVAEQRLASLKPGSTDLAALRLKGDHLEQRYTLHLSMLEQGRAALAEYNRVAATRARLTAQINRENRTAQYLPALTALRTATGKRGLRLARIEELANTFQAEFNRLVGLFWPEDFRLDLVIKSNGLHLLATRAGAREDLSGTSGSENKVFRMLCALALIRILPPPFRCDTIILDELDANLDPHTEHRLAREYLPVLQANVSKLIFITPRDLQATGLAPDRVFSTVKQGSSSQLERIR